MHMGSNHLSKYAASDAGLISRTPLAVVIACVFCFHYSAMHCSSFIQPQRMRGPRNFDLNYSSRTVPRFPQQSTALPFRSAGKAKSHVETCQSQIKQTQSGLYHQGTICRQGADDLTCFQSLRSWPIIAYCLCYQTSEVH